MDMNGTKRKRSSASSGVERPVKQVKPENSSASAQGAANGLVGDADAAADADADAYADDAGSSLPLGTTSDSPEWQATLETVVKSVVSIQFCQTCSFDTDLSMCSQATGFVVDAERGYILTNRHVVCSGPFWGYCVFDNHEEVGLFFWFFTLDETLY